MTESPPNQDPFERPADLESLKGLWEGRNPGEWQTTPRYYVVLGERAIHLGHPALAWDILEEATESNPNHKEIGYLAALSATNLGSLGVATQRLKTVVHGMSPGDALYRDAISLRGRIERSVERRQQFWG